MDNKINILIVDDSSFMRGLLTRMIEKDPRFQVIGKAENGQQGVEMAKQLKPHIVTMDIEMPVMDGLQALEKIMKEDPRPVIMVSSLTEKGASETMKALDLGAIDFLPKAMQDKEKNILQAGDILHEKLLAAARAGLHMGRVQTIPKPITSTPVTETVVAKAPSEKVLNKKHAKILVIGSSTGGPRALGSLLESLPKLNVPIVIAQHMPTKFTAAMAERIDKSSQLDVKEAENGETLKPGTVYVAPGGLHMRIKLNGSSFVTDIREDAGESVYKPSVDVLGESVLEVAGEDIIAVMLTGMGSDGANAFEKIHNKGGYVIAQDEESCVVYGMSRAVVKKNAANEILSIENIGKKLVQLLS